MNNNVIFTIVAKNYLALAKTLMESFKNNNPNWAYDTKLYIFVADEFEGGQNFTVDNCSIIECKHLDIKDYNSLAFKYDITEFCTALKPFCVDYLAYENVNSRIIYFDPDICVFSSLNPIFEALENKLCVLTPHYITPEINYSGVVPEEMILWVGIFNLGFVAINTTSPKYRIFIEWWKNRLYDKCYADKQDGLHTDQKWLDYLPSYFPNDIHISHNMGYNVSIWNLHERKIVKDGNGLFYINSTDEQGFKLTFFHFSGFDFENKKVIHKHHPALDTTVRPDMVDLLEFYRLSLLNNGFKETIRWKYSYSKYTNGQPITQFQRRLYRRLLQMEVNFADPFNSIDKNGFFDILKKNNLVGKSSLTDKLKANNIAEYSGKIKLMFFLMKKLQFLVGADKYSLLLKFLYRYSRPENQIFLIEQFKEKFTFYNENRIDSINLK